MAENPRIEELRRRVQKDPASIAFAQLAEEYRRSGDYDEAVQVCRTGLETHPTYLSARVTLGRALIELGRFDEAHGELEAVLRSAPENLAAIRGLAEIHQRRGELGEALKQYQTALGLAQHDPDLEQSVTDISRQLGSEAPAATPPPIPDVPVVPPPIPMMDLPELSVESAESGPAATADEPAAPDPQLSPALEAAADEFSKALEALGAFGADEPDVTPAQDSAPPPVPVDAAVTFDAADSIAGEPPPPAERQQAAETGLDMSAFLSEAPAADASAEKPDLSALWDAKGPTSPDAPAASEGDPFAAAPAPTRRAAVADALERWLDAITLDRRTRDANSQG